MVRRRLGHITGLLLLACGSLQAQVRSPVQDLLASARAALNDLRYAEADSITIAVLRLDQLRRVERIQALQLSAGATFPEQVPAQQRERALASLRQLVRIAPSAILPREVSWTGLEDLYREAKQSTFGASASPRDQNVLTGPDELAEIDVITSRPATVNLRLEPIGRGAVLFLDSARINGRGAMRFKVLKNGQPSIPSGNYNLLISAVDEVAPDTIRLSYETTINAPPIEYLNVSTDLDEKTLLPERTRPRRVGGIVAGVLALASTITVSRVMRDDALKGAVAVDGRAVTLGVVLGLGTAGGVWALDKGAPIPANIQANEKTKADFSRGIADASARNAELLRTYHAEITINPTVKP